MGNVCPQQTSSNQQVEINVTPKELPSQQNISVAADPQIGARQVLKDLNKQGTEIPFGSAQVAPKNKQSQNTTSQANKSNQCLKCWQCAFGDGDNRVFVIRRQLRGAPTKYKAIAHSALLLRISGQYYILEYMQDSKTHLTKVDKTKVFLKSVQDEHSWAKQKRGTKITQADITVKQIRKTMKLIMKQSSYNALNHCCHVAQEAVRFYYRWAEITQLSYQITIRYLKCPYCGRQFGQNLNINHFMRKTNQYGQSYSSSDDSDDRQDLRSETSGLFSDSSFYPFIKECNRK